MNGELDSSYVNALQQRVLYDVLMFFHENYFLNNNTLVNTFKQLCILACNCLCFNFHMATTPTDKGTISPSASTASLATMTASSSSSSLLELALADNQYVFDAHFSNDWTHVCCACQVEYK
jgi:hypothetical protein